MKRWGIVGLLFVFAGLLHANQAPYWVIKRTQELEKKLSLNFGSTKDSVNIWVKELIDLSEKHDYQEGLIVGHKFEGMYAHMNDEYAAANSAFRKMYELLNFHPMEEEWFDYHYYMFSIYSEVGDSTRAINSLYEAELNCNRRGEFGLLPRVYNRFIFYYASFNPQKAWEYVHKAENLLNSVESQYQAYDRAQLHQAIGRIHKFARESEQAKYHLDKAVKIGDSINWRGGCIPMKIDKGIVYYENCQMDSARLAFLEAAEQCNDFDSRKWQARCLNNLGEIAMYEGDWKGAIKYFNEAYVITAQTKFRFYDAIMVKNLIKAYQKEGDLEQAVIWAHRCDSIQEEIDLWDKECRISLLENENQVFQLKANQQLKKQEDSFMMWTKIVGFIVFLIAIGVVYKMIRDRRKRLQLERELSIVRQRQNNEAPKIFRVSDLKKKNINHEAEDDVHENLEHCFNDVFKAFYARLSIKHPHLSEEEKKVCAFLKLNMTPEEIAEITGLTIVHIHVIKDRIVKDFNLENNPTVISKYFANI